jgi:hypothetical protein
VKKVKKVNVLKTLFSDINKLNEEEFDNLTLT